MSDTTTKKQPHELPSWEKLNQHKEAKTEAKTVFRKMFAEAPSCFEGFKRRFEEVLVDFSKNLITEEACGLSSELADARDSQISLNWIGSHVKENGLPLNNL